MVTREEIMAAIAREREYQERKWGPIEERPHTVAEWLVIMQGELDEALQSWRKADGVGMMQELLQVVAVGVAALEQHGVVERVYPPYDFMPDQWGRK